MAWLASLTLRNIWATVDERRWDTAPTDTPAWDDGGRKKDENWPRERDLSLAMEVSRV